MAQLHLVFGLKLSIIKNGESRSLVIKILFKVQLNASKLQQLNSLKERIIAIRQHITTF